MRLDAFGAGFPDIGAILTQYQSNDNAAIGAAEAETSTVEERERYCRWLWLDRDAIAKFLEPRGSCD